MADLVIVGAGPQALTLSCLLLQKRSRLHRRLQIVDPRGRWLSRWQCDRQLERVYGLLHNDLFAAFCREVINEFALEERVQATCVEQISLPVNGKGPLELSLSDGTTMQAWRLVIETGNGTP